MNRIYDLACGHGLVGMLLAYRFPRKQVVAVDLERRQAWDAYMQAWSRCGQKLPGWDHPLANVEFREDDLKSVRGEVKNDR